jgi:hypothetical protein
MKTHTGEHAKPSLGRQNILQLMRAAPEGLTTVELATGLGASCRDLGGRLSKLAAYGEIERLERPFPSAKTKWRVSQKRK